ncbi:MAG TPA: OsmC family protein [Acidimicrobiia bacterium]|nr:OsmC family protein [Acidimicrobiia bacterium]
MSTRTTMPLNGVDVPTLFATLDVVKATPPAAEFQFRASNRWHSGTHSRSSIHGFFGAGDEQTHKTVYELDADHPEVLVGGDNGPTPVEFLLHAIAACITAGIGNIASARGIELHKVESWVEGDINLNGILGFDDSVRNGFRQLRVRFEIEGDAPRDVLEGIVAQSIARSAVYDVLTNGVPVDIEVAS